MRLPSVESWNEAMPRAIWRWRSRRARSSTLSFSSAPFQDVGGGQQHFLLLPGDVVLVEILHEAARAGAQEEHELAVRSQRDGVGLAEPES
jgi:hypothetical protein